MATDLDAEAALAPARAYDLAAPFYDDWDWQGFWRRVEFPAIRRRLHDWAAGRRPRLVDVGCGTGWTLGRLAAGCATATGLDISRAMLGEARRRLPATPLICADARALPVRSTVADALVCARVLSHLPEVDGALAEIARVLEPGGMAILTDVDAAHDYRQTRLPLAAGHVAAETFKHPRASLQGALERAGLRHAASELLFLDAASAGVAELGDPTPRTPVGWVTAWLRP